MISRLFRLIVLAAAAAGVAAVIRALTARDDAPPTPAPDPTGGPWPPLRNETVAPEPAGVPVADEPSEPAAPPSTGARWLAPNADGTCPEGHPVKAKMSSKIFHSPGQMNYDRTSPDRCYVDAAAAEADGLRAAKR